MNININILQNGSEKIHTTCSLQQNKDADDIALLVASSEVSGTKHFFVSNKEMIARLIVEFKINLGRVEYTEIHYLEDVADNIWNISDASIFIFNYYRLTSNPVFSEPSFPPLYIDHELQLMFAESDQDKLKNILIDFTSLNNIIIYIPEYDKPISVQIQDASGKFSIVSFANGKKTEKDYSAGPLGKEYHRLTVEQKANEEILRIAVKSYNDVIIIYPSRDEEEIEWYETDRLIDIKKSDELDIKSEYIFRHFEGKNLANEKVKYPNPIDENGEPVPDHLLSAYDSKLAKEGLKRYIPTIEEIERKNSLTAIRQYIEYRDSSLLLNDNIARDISTILSERFDNKKVEFLAVSENIFDLKKTLVSIAEKRDIFILKFDRFINHGSIDYGEYEDLWNWVRYYKRNLIYSVSKRFNG